MFVKKVLMDTLELEPKSSLDPILNYSTSSEASSVVGNIGSRLSLLENVSLENETILSKCTNESINNGGEHNFLKLSRNDRKTTVPENVENILNSPFSTSINLELSSELEFSLENSDLSILMKSRNSAMTKKDIFKHFYKLNVIPLMNTNETVNVTQSNLTVSSQEKEMNYDKKYHVPLKLDDNDHPETISISSLNQSNNTFMENTMDNINIKKEFRENFLISSGLENKSAKESINEKKKISLNRTNYEFFKLSEKNKVCIFSNSEIRKKNIFKNELKQCEVKLFDYLVEQETYDGRYIEKNEIIDEVFNKVIHGSTKEKKPSDADLFIEENGSNNDSIREKGVVKNNLTEKNITLVENNKENIKEFINYLKKSASLDYKLDKSNLYQYADDFLNGSHHKISNKAKGNFQDIKDENNETFNKKNKTNVESTKNNVKNNKQNHNIYSKYRECNKFKFNDEYVISKISQAKEISDNYNDKNKETRSLTLYESDNYSNLEENDSIGDVTDRVSSRLRKKHRSKPNCTRRKSLPKRITEENIKKVVHNITSTLMSSKSNIKINKVLKENKSKTNIINDSDMRSRLRKFPQTCKNQIKTHLNTAEISKFLMSKLLHSSKTNTLLDCEDIIEKLNILIRNSKSKRHNINNIILKFKKLLYENSICKNYIEFYTFISNFTPFYFQNKVMPLGGAFGCNGPKVTKKLSDPLKG